MVLVAAPDPSSGRDFTAVYEEHHGLLVGIAVGRFHVPVADAETLAHEVFFEYLVGEKKVVDHRAWLVGAICNASRYYLRKSNRTEPLPEDGPEPLDPRSARAKDVLPDQLAARQAFACLTPRCQLALRLRYIEGYTVPEIAQILGTTKKYAQKLVGRCLEQANRRYCGSGM